MSIQLKTNFPFKKKPNGQGMTEFALVIPIFLMLVLGVLEMGRLLFVYSAVFTASREAARYGAAVGIGPNGKPYFQDCTGMRNAAKGMGSLAGLQDSDIIIAYDNPDSGKSGITCNDQVVPRVPANDQIELGDRVIATVHISYTPIFGFLGLPDFNIQSTSRRTIVRELRFDGPTPLPSLTVNPQTATAMTATSGAITSTASYHQTSTSIANTATAAFHQTATSAAITATAAFNQTATSTAITATAAFNETATATAITATAAMAETMTALAPTITPTPTSTSTPTRTPTATSTPAAVCPEPQPYSVTSSGSTITLTIDNTVPGAQDIRIDALLLSWEPSETYALQQIETTIGNNPSTVVWTGSSFTVPTGITTWLEDGTARTIAPNQSMDLTFTFSEPPSVNDLTKWWAKITFSNKCSKTWTGE